MRLIYDRAKQKTVRGEQLGVINSLLPSLRASGSTATEEINLAALGFNPYSSGSIFSQLGIDPASIPLIVKVHVTQAQISADQDLFDLPAYELYKGAKRETEVVDLDVLTSRGDLVLSVGSAYLQVLADQTNLTNAQAQELRREDSLRPGEPATQGRRRHKPRRTPRAGGVPAAPAGLYRG